MRRVRCQGLEVSCQASRSCLCRRCYFHQHLKWSEEVKRSQHKHDPLIGTRKTGRKPVRRLCRCGVKCKSAREARDHCRSPKSTQNFSRGELSLSNRKRSKNKKLPKLANKANLLRCSVVGKELILAVRRCIVNGQGELVETLIGCYESFMTLRSRDFDFNCWCELKSKQYERELQQCIEDHNRSSAELTSVPLNLLAAGKAAVRR